jgi:hypothetical protein
MATQTSTRAERVRTAIVELLTDSATPLCTTQISEAIRTPHRLHGKVPDQEFIGHTHIYPALCALERHGLVARLPRAGVRDAVWWRLTSATEQVDAQPVELPQVEIEPVDLDALLAGDGR